MYLSLPLSLLQSGPKSAADLLAEAKALAGGRRPSASTTSSVSAQVSIAGAAAGGVELERLPRSLDQMATAGRKESSRARARYLLTC